MKKRLLALLLTAALLLGAVPSVSVAAALPAEVRDTNFFTPLPHGDLSFSEMEYVAVDVAEELERMDRVRTLAQDAANQPQVRSGFDEVCDAYRNASTMYALATIYDSMDYADAAAGGRLQEAEQNLVLVQDGLFQLVRDILNSPCAAALEGLLEAEDVAELEDYEPVTQEELDRNERETALEDEYWQLAAKTYTCEYDGTVWNEAAALAGLNRGTLGGEDYLAITRAIEQKRNEALGTHYLKMAELRKEIAMAAGYETYTEYAYQVLYGRDYSPEEIHAFHQGVKEELSLVYNDLRQLWYDWDTPPSFYQDYTGDTALDLMEPCIAVISDELLESFHYMRTHGLYDITPGTRKNDQSYTVSLPAYQAAFFFSNPDGGAWDLLTAIHEFGHFNDAYWTDGLWYCGGKGIDIAEVHSQGLELLFSRFYPELFGEDADGMLVYLLLNKVWAIIGGALQDELQQYVYATPGVTLSQINQEYCRLCKEYGVIDADDDRTELYDWVDTPHYFASPLYYVSYAVSAAGAFSFWLDSLEAYEGAVDSYLRFTALDLDHSFQESFAAVGLESPVSGAYLRELAGALEREILKLSGFPFVDVARSDWYFEAVNFAWRLDMFRGTAEDTFSPVLPMNRAMAVTVLYRLSDEPTPLLPTPALIYSDVYGGQWYSDAVSWATERGIVRGYGDGTFGPERLVTRQELAVMLYRLARMGEYGYAENWRDSPLAFADDAEIAGYAREAMHWMVEHHVLAGDGSRLHPGKEATRAEVAQILMNFTEFLVLQLIG